MPDYDDSKGQRSGSKAVDAETASRTSGYAGGKAPYERAKEAGGLTHGDHATEAQKHMASQTKNKA